MGASTKRFLYLNPITGIAGDMFFAALLDLGGDQGWVEEQLRRLPLENWTMQVEERQSLGIRGLHLQFCTEESHVHRHLSPILNMIDQAQFPPKARDIAKKTFIRLAEAEAQVHSCTPEDIHFHEVGAMDSLLDICGVALLLNQLQIEEVYCGVLPLSRGYVDCAHGRLPVPAPAAAKLLQGFHLVGTELEGELITPTGAALLAALGAQQTPPPAFSLLSQGQGLGSRTLPIPNALWAMLCQTEAETDLGLDQDEIEMLKANVDDSSGELLGHLTETLLQAGALDVCTMPIFMKKARPAWQIQIIAKLGQGQSLAKLLFQESTVIGCRITRERRFVQPRRSFSVATPYGPVLVKASGNTLAPEADSVRQCAAEAQVPWKQVYQAALCAAHCQKKEEK